jgi:hypothetical protein
MNGIFFFNPLSWWDVKKNIILLNYYKFFGQFDLLLFRWHLLGMGFFFDTGWELDDAFMINDVKNVIGNWTILMTNHLLPAGVDITVKNKTKFIVEQKS